MRLIDSRALPTAKKDLNELHRWIAETPETCTVKGMYVSGIHQALQHEGVEPPAGPGLQAFKDYPLRGYMELLLNSALTLYPDIAPKESLRMLGRLAIPTFARSIIGSVIMATTGRKWERTLKVISRGYEVSLKPGKAVVAEISPDRALVQLREVWNFGDSYQVGVLEGLMQFCDVRGHIKAHRQSLCDFDLEIQLENRALPKQSR